MLNSDKSTNKAMFNIGTPTSTPAEYSLPRLPLVIQALWPNSAVARPGPMLNLGPVSWRRRPSSDDSFHSPTVIPPSALNKPSIMKRCHCWRTCSHTSPRRSPTTVTLHDTRFVECRWWNDGWTVKTVVT